MSAIVDPYATLDTPPKAAASPPPIGGVEAIAPPPKNPAGGRPLRRAILFLVQALVLEFCAMTVDEDSIMGPVAKWIVLLNAMSVAVAGACYAGSAVVHAMRSSPRRGWRAAGGLVIALVGAAMTGLGMMIALSFDHTVHRGRQLRRFGRVILPKLRPGGSAPLGLVEPLAEVPSAVAERWRENAVTEYASVAAFARLTLDLVALGAPPELVEAANRDTLDEVRHTHLCLAMAEAIDGQRAVPAPFPEAQRVSTLPRVRTLALAILALESLIDGALHEGVSARIVARLARVAEVPGIRSTLATIAADEGRHAAHGWQVVEWCAREGGEPVLRAIEGAMGKLSPTMRSPLPTPAASGQWIPWGIQGHALEAEEYTKARAHLVRRVEGLRAQAIGHAACPDTC